MTAVIAIINFDGKILIGKKRADSTKFLRGQWHVPGESVKKEESYEEALIRGMKEETGLEIVVGNYMASHKTPTSKSEARWYECFSDTDKATPGSDLEELKWVEKREVLKYCHNRIDIWPKEIVNYFST